MRKFLKYSIFLINLLVAALLVCSRLIPFSNPYEYNFLGLLGLLTPVLVVINSGFIFFWLFSRKYLFMLLPMAAIWLSWKVFSVCIAGNFNAVQYLSKTDSSLTLMSYNVRQMDLYHWNADKDTRNKLIEFFRKKNPSVLCLQEFYSNNDSSSVNNNSKAIREACHYEYFSECNMHVSKRGKWSSVIFSHLPIVDEQNFEIDVQGNNLLQKADIVFNKDTFSVFNVHLKSNQFNKKEADLVNKDVMPSLSDSNFKQSKFIVQKLQDNAVNRGLEADIIASVISQNDYPAILCGDLNDIPCSYVYFTVRDHLKDVFLEKGLGLGKTYRNMIPVLRIDYIFHDQNISLLGYEKMDVPYSDHEPLMANFSILRPGKHLQ